MLRESRKKSNDECPRRREKNEELLVNFLFIIVYYLGDLFLCPDGLSIHAWDYRKSGVFHI